MVTAVGSVLEEAVEAYNDYRSPMARAEPLDTDGDEFTVRFEGPFCTTSCCRDDYFEDLVYELDELGVDRARLSVTEIRQVDREAFEVTYEHHRRE